MKFPACLWRTHSCAMSLSFLTSGTGPFVGQGHALPAAFEPGGATHEGARAHRELERYSPITLAGHGPALQVPLVSMLGKLSGIAHSCVPHSHSCERKGVRKSANTARRSACATAVVEIYAAGNRTRKAAPPSSPCTSRMSPPESSALLRAMESPRPMPPRLKEMVGSNRVVLALTPGPES
jgi:hypothetical protein